MAALGFERPATLVNRELKRPLRPYTAPVGASVGAVRDDLQDAAMANREYSRNTSMCVCTGRAREGAWEAGRERRNERKRHGCVEVGVGIHICTSHACRHRCRHANVG